MAELTIYLLGCPLADAELGIEMIEAATARDTENLSMSCSSSEGGTQKRVFMTRTSREFRQ